MSPPGRPKGERAPERAARRVVSDPPGRPKGEQAPERAARRVVSDPPGRVKPAVDTRFRLRLTRGDDILLGPGKVDLLEAIAREGSITAAAKALHMSYRRAWLLVDTMNRNFRAPVVEAGAGGAQGGGAALTSLGHEVVARYRRIETQAAKAAADDLRRLKGLVRG